MIAQRLEVEPETEFAVACHTATGGNPLLLHELIKAVAVEVAAPTAANADIVAELGPRAASRAVLLRLSRLMEEAGAVARVGWLARKHGLQTNAVTAIEVVTADGELRVVDAETTGSGRSAEAVATSAS